MSVIYHRGAVSRPCGIEITIEDIPGPA